MRVASRHVHTMNQFTTLSLLAKGLLLLAAFSNGNAEETCRNINAAFYFDSSLFLISGEDYFKIGNDMVEVDAGKLTDKFSRAPAQVDAATVWSGDDTLYLFSGSQYYFYSNWFNYISGPYRNSRWTPFFVDGIDAAARCGDKTYFFKGCEYVTYEFDYSEVGHIHDIGLPCDVDAAWDQGDVMVVVKGTQSWALHTNGNVRGPVLLSSQITLTSTALCESETKADWSEKVRSELLYETQNGCVIIDAALNYEGDVYLFNGGSYIRLNAEGEEERMANTYDWGGLGKNIGAAISVENNGKTYFFQGDAYFTYYALAFGPFSSNSWAPVFSAGIDAAGTRQGMSFFFQGCRVIHYEVKEKTVSEIYNSDDLGLPCDVDAAYSKGDDLVVIKGNRIWIWGDDVRGPGPLSEIVSLTSWETCQ